MIKRFILQRRLQYLGRLLAMLPDNSEAFHVTQEMYVTVAAVLGSK